MITVELLKQLYSAIQNGDTNSEARMMKEMGEPSQDVITDFAISQMGSSDRNVRVLMLRMACMEHNEGAVEVILKGLNDPKRRVRTVAAKCARTYMENSKIGEKIQEIISNPEETRKVQVAAFGSLVPAMARQAVESARTGVQLPSDEKLRSRIFFQLLMMDMTDGVESLLKDFVQTGTRNQAIMATRALCGYKVISLGSIPDEAKRKEIARTAEKAAGEVYFWVRRDS